ncbi:MaoC family dehydratase [Clostridium sp. E02]|uniref:MaoC family dehydratase n=1 Tax=Clostridium sp. E02 TaxID=2487134 RepID=UPI000F5305A6|nr:MaoC family dehydratase [Clostridium sp. E02]
MVIGIKYCGGCNPVYDRARRVRRFMEENPAHEYKGALNEQTYDYWMVVCGCSRRCAKTNGLIARKNVFVVWDEESFHQMEQELKRAEGKKILKLYDKVVLSKRITGEDTTAFSNLTGDENRIHRDVEVARKAGFDRPIIPGMFVDSLVSSVMGTKLPGDGTLYLEHNARFMRPVYPGDTIEVTVSFYSYEERKDCYVGSFRGTCKNQKGDRVLVVNSRQMMRKELFCVKVEREETDDDKFRTV